MEGKLCHGAKPADITGQLCCTTEKYDYEAWTMGFARRLYAGKRKTPPCPVANVQC